MDTSRVISQLKQDEGWSATVYDDHLGFKTVGYGFLVDERRGGGMPKEVGEYWLAHNVHGIIHELHRRLSCWERLPQPVKEALVNMAYQLGTRGLLGFRKTLELIDMGHYAEAADEALVSRWATQTPNRAKRVTDLIRSAG